MASRAMLADFTLRRWPEKLYYIQRPTIFLDYVCRSSRSSRRNKSSSRSSGEGCSSVRGLSLSTEPETAERTD